MSCERCEALERALAEANRRNDMLTDRAADLVEAAQGHKARAARLARELARARGERDRLAADRDFLAAERGRRAAP